MFIVVVVVVFKYFSLLSRIPLYVYITIYLLVDELLLRKHLVFGVRTSDFLSACFGPFFQVLVDLKLFGHSANPRT